MPVIFDRLIVIMGVSGCGKSTVAQALAEQISAVYLEGDDFHPIDNKEKMNKGIPLTDNDRWPWLSALASEMAVASRQGIAVISCSALKKTYREFITQNAGASVLFIYLRGDRKILSERLGTRENHFMNAGLLDSQLTTLEQPDTTENAIYINIDSPVNNIVQQIIQAVPKLRKLQTEHK